MNRRECLSAMLFGGSVMSAGCGQGVLDGTRDVPAAHPVTSTVDGESAAFSNQGERFSGNETLDAGSSFETEVTFGRTTKLSYTVTVTGDRTVDVFLLDSSNIDAYRSAESFDYLHAGSVLNTQHGEAAVVLPPGTYSLVVDNSRIGEATPLADTASIDVAVSGRLQNAPGGIPTKSPITATPGEYSTQFDSITRTFRVDTGRWQAVGFSLKNPAKIEYEIQVTNGHLIDVFLLEESEKSRFEAEEPFEYVDGGSLLKTLSGSTRVVIPSGSYAIVVDNGRMGVANPSDRGSIATVELSGQLFGK